MADFKFFGKNEDAFERIFDEAERLEAANANERFERMLQLHFPSDGLPDPQALTTRFDPELHGMPGLFLNVQTNRNEMADGLYADICKAQRMLLIERMFDEGLVTHTIVSQDDNGFTLRTEINL